MYWCNLSKHSYTAKHVGVQLWRLPLWTAKPPTWELSLSTAGNPGQWEIPWPLQLAFSKLCWGEGTGGHLCTLKMWVIPSEDGIPVEKHLGKAPFYFPLLEICNQTIICSDPQSARLSLLWVHTWSDLFMTATGLSSFQGTWDWLVFKGY